MTLTNREWGLVFAFHRIGETFTVHSDDTADPADTVRVLADGFRMSWAFQDEVSPGPLEPETLSVTLACTTAADVPGIEKGDLVVVTVYAYDPAPMVSAVVSYRVTDLIAVEVNGRMELQITATTAPGNLDQIVDVRSFLTAAGQATWMAYSDATNVVPSPEGAFALAKLLDPAFMGTEWFYATVMPAGSYRGAGLKLPETISVADLVAAAHELWFAPAGADGYASGLAAVAIVQPQFGGHEYTLVGSGGWDPQGYAPQAAPLLLTYVGSVLDTDLQPDWTMRGNSAASVAFLDASHIEASPEWRKAGTTRVTAVQYSGSRRTSADPTTDADTIATAALPDVPAASGTLRTIDASGYLSNALNAATGFITYGGKPAADAMLLGSDAGGWAPSEFTVLPRRMDDDQWLQLTLGAFWPSSGDALKLQRTIVIFNIDDDANMAAGPVWLTMIGCDLAIPDGHLEITPSCRPYVPPRITGITDAVTWAQLKATYPAATWAQADAVTWAEAGISTI